MFNWWNASTKHIPRQISTPYNIFISKNPAAQTEVSDTCLSKYLLIPGYREESGAANIRLIRMQN